ncbi:hypothetical protein BGZ49_006211 [Haplosporangium sp. Z 27]|nr:hypothetical protein BGZ49_006211 [Haplosporangium sp. Z 27]
MTLDNDPDEQLEIKNLKLAKKEMVNRNEDVPDLPSADSDSELEPDPNAYLKMREEKIRENQLKLAAMFSSFETAGDITDTTQLDTAANSFSFSSLRLRSFPANSDGDNAGLPSPDPRRRLSRSASVNESIYLTAKQVDEQQEKHELAYNMRYRDDQYEPVEQQEQK